jgi:hypothetical protein
MLNTTGRLAVMDHGVTLNWEDGPTLHRMTAQVGYHTAMSPTAQPLRMRVLATTSHEGDGDPFTFTQTDESIRAEWTWREGIPTHAPSEAVLHWVVQLAVTNLTDQDLFLDTLDVIRIDAAYAGQFNLGAPPGLWRCADESFPTDVRWEAWSQSAASAKGFRRSHELLVQPSMSNRTRPPALLVRVADATTELAQPVPTEIALEMSGERFERMTARTVGAGARLAANSTFASAWFLLASGDDVGELRGLLPVLDE